MEKVDAHSPPETCQLISQSGVAKAKLPWADLIVKSFFGGVFISLGSLFDLVIAGGAPGLRSSNPSLATMIAAFSFPIGFVLVIITNVELVTSNMAVMVFSTLQRKTSIYDLTRNWVTCYIFNLAGCLFYGQLPPLILGRSRQTLIPLIDTVRFFLPCKVLKKLPCSVALNANLPICQFA
jgi:formate/nitrite transporter FocA (FNT family)